MVAIIARKLGDTTLSAFAGQRPVGSTGQAAVLDASQIKRLIKIAQTTNHSDRDQTVVVLSYWLGLRAKELASPKIGDVYLSCDEAPKVGTGFGTSRRTNDQFEIKQPQYLTPAKSG